MLCLALVWLGDPGVLSVTVPVLGETSTVYSELVLKKLERKREGGREGGTEKKEEGKGERNRKHLVFGHLSPDNQSSALKFQNNPFLSGDRPGL